MPHWRSAPSRASSTSSRPCPTSTSSSTPSCPSDDRPLLTLRIVPCPAGAGSGPGELAQERQTPGLLGSITGDSRHEVSSAGVGQPDDGRLDCLLVTDERDVASYRGPFLVQHGPVGRQV